MSECWIAAQRAVPKEVTGQLDGGKEHGTAGVDSLGSVIVVGRAGECGREHETAGVDSLGYVIVVGRAGRPLREPKLRSSHSWFPNSCFILARLFPCSFCFSFRLVDFLSSHFLSISSCRVWISRMI